MSVGVAASLFAASGVFSRPLSLFGFWVRCARAEGRFLAYEETFIFSRRSETTFFCAVVEGVDYSSV